MQVGSADRVKRLARLAVCGVALAALTGVLAAPWPPAQAEDPPGAADAPRYAFLVGGSTYLYGSRVGLADLNYADDDALEFGDALLELGWSAERIDVLVQADSGQASRASRLAGRVIGPPTKAAIAKAWSAFVERVKADSAATGRRAAAVALLLSGHGVEVKGQPKGGLKVENTYFVPVDAEAMAADALVDVQAMLDDLQALPASRRLFVYDACRKSVDAASRDYAASSTMLQRLRVPEGTFLLLSCKSDEVSYESKSLGHGVFLHHLIDGMRGKAANADGLLTITSLADYAASGTERWVQQNLSGSVQRPVLKSEGSTWVLADRIAEEPAWARGLVSDVQRAEARRLRVPVAYEDAAVEMRFVLIPGGTFTMGSPAEEVGRHGDEGPRHLVRISSFYLALHEVTNEQYRRRQPSHDSGEFNGKSMNGARQPATMVLHADAESYAAGISTRDGALPYRLPSEAEWEYACRAGSLARWSFGDDERSLNEYGWHLGNSGMRTHDVGTKLPNGWGLLDMHGNVFEWCADDWHFSYDGAPIDGAAWIDRPRGDRRVARGGAWGDPPENLRCANRYGLRASERPGPVGFRLARSIPTR